MKSYQLFYFILITGLPALFVKGAPSLNSNSKSSSDVMIAVDDDISSKHTQQILNNGSQTNPAPGNINKLNNVCIQS